MTIIRDVTLLALKYLNQEEILLFTGARQAGKTTILKQLRDKLEKENLRTYFFNLEDPEYRELLDKSPKNLLKIVSLDKQRIYVFIDEIQYLANPTNFLKYVFDEYKDKIKLLVSGSSAFYLDKRFRDSLVGRKKIFNVRTLSFAEFLRFKNESGLEEIFKSSKVLGLLDKEKVSLLFREYMTYGGYPRVVLAPYGEKEEILGEIAYSYIKKDIFEAGLRSDENFYMLLKILASQVGSLVNSSELASTLKISKNSVDNYLYICQKSFHLCLVRPFFRNVRKELTKMPKVFFYDLGLRNFFSGGFESFETRDDKGQVLENAVFRELLEKFGEDSIRFWRTTQNQEVDFVVSGKEAFEVKTSIDRFKEGRYKVFMKNYKNIKLSIVSLDKGRQAVGQHNVLQPWEI